MWTLNTQKRANGWLKSLNVWQRKTAQGFWLSYRRLCPLRLQTFHCCPTCSPGACLSVLVPYGIYSFICWGLTRRHEDDMVSDLSKLTVCCCCCYVASVVSNSVRPCRWQPTRLPRPWDSLSKNTGVGCHFLLQCMKVKSENEVAQLCLTLRDPMDCSPPGSSIHGIFQARVLEWDAIAFSDSTAKLLLYI